MALVIWTSRPHAPDVEMCKLLLDYSEEAGVQEGDAGVCAGCGPGGGARAAAVGG